MDKLTMAHEMALKIAESGVSVDICAGLGWRYADAMQAEADKRNKAEAEQKRKEMRDLLNAENTFIEREGQHFDDVEWQPDWSVAPEGFNWWAMDGFSNKANWYKSKPYLDGDGDGGGDEWNIVLTESDTYKEAPLFNYQGDWYDSLRKRPEMEAERRG